MFKCKNVGNKERIVRMIGGCLMILYGLLGSQITWLAISIAGVGVVSLLTGAFRYCPMRAVACRKPTSY